MEILLKDYKDEYEGKYVALKSFLDREVVSFGKKPNKVIKEAENKGFESPVIFFIPKKNMANFY